MKRVSEGNKTQGRQIRLGADSNPDHPDLRGSPFLTVAVVSPEVLRAQEEWEAVNSIQPETGNCKNGTISIQSATGKGTVHM